MACWGDAASAGHHQTTPGWRPATVAAIMRALLEAGEERKPSRYNKWLVVMVEG
jgi:hypothetical protein